MSPSDTALLRVLLAIDDLADRSEDNAMDAGLVSRRLNGRLASYGCVHRSISQQLSA